MLHTPNVPTPTALSGASTPVLLPSERPPLGARSSSSTSSILFGDYDVDVISMEGLPHAEVKLEARKYKSTSFAERLLPVIKELAIPSWSNVSNPSAIRVSKVAGSLTNAVFFVSAPSASTPNGTPRTLLLRIYGPSSGSLISRPRELRTLHVLSSQYKIGPRVYGTFANGRLEEFFDSSALTAAEMRDLKVSRWIGMRMAELHCVDIGAVEEAEHAPELEGTAWDLAARKNVRSWLGPAREVLALPSVAAAVRAELDLDAFEREWAQYMLWLAEYEHEHGKSKRVFAHNDTQYGNLLRSTHPKPGVPEHRQIIVVDFEYAAPNAAAFDIANHFHEWMADYHGPTPHVLRPERYPTLAERRNFYAGYLAAACPPFPSGACAPGAPAADEQELAMLDAQVRAWSAASHGMWAVWGIVQAREDLEGKDGEAEFDYIGYSKCRLELFRREVRRLGLGM